MLTQADVLPQHALPQDLAMCLMLFAHRPPSFPPMAKEKRKPREKQGSRGLGLGIVLQCRTATADGHPLGWAEGKLSITSCRLARFAFVIRRASE